MPTSSEAFPKSTPTSTPAPAPKIAPLPPIARGTPAPAAVAVAIPAAETEPTPATAPFNPMDFFKPRERISKKEYEALALYRALEYFKEQSSIKSLLASLGNEDFHSSRLARHLYTICNEQINQTNIPDIQGNPSRFYDGFEIQKIIEATAINEAKEALNPEIIPKALPYFYQVSDDQGPRPKMEDKWVAYPYINDLLGMKSEPVYSVFSVYDGHGGPAVAEYLAKHLHVNIFRDEYFSKSPKDAIREGFLSTNEAFFQFADRDALGDNVGSTAVFTMIKDNKQLYVAWAGDSEACLYKKTGESKQLCEPHKPWVAKERERILQMGGTVEEKGGAYRVCGALAVSRAFGDARFRQYLTADPDIVVLDLTGDEEFLVVACDGLWDVMNSQAVGVFLQQHRGESKEGMTEALVSHARSLGSTDNITAVVVVFQ